MARPQSKVLSAADQKVATAANKEAFKNAKQTLKDATAALKAHEKEVGAKTKELTKARDAAQKAHDKLAPAPAAA